MNFHQILQHVKTDSLASVGAYGPELALIAAVLLVLLLRVPRWTRSFPSLIVALIGSGAAFVLALAECVQAEAGSLSTLGEPIFTGLLVHDNLSICFRMLLTGFAFLLLILTWLTKMPDAENAPDVYAMILGSVIGMCIMASANNMLMVFFGIEMASVPSYVLAGTIKGRKVASEAALKFAVYGAGTAGVMLYGISLVSGALGTLHLPTMAEQLAQVLADGGDKQLVLFLGGLMIMVGFAFKLSAVPFQFWCPDVFEGATAEVNAFLSVASKAAALALLIRVACGLGGESLVHDAPHNPPVETTAATAAAEPVVILVASETNRDSAAGESAATISKVEALRPARDYIVFVISLLAGL
ncbi:MAG: proton-conducting transporter membrane subunit, partial [Planctomycetales bacterium]